MLTGLTPLEGTGPPLWRARRSNSDGGVARGVRGAAVKQQRAELVERDQPRGQPFAECGAVDRQRRRSGDQQAKRGVQHIKRVRIVVGGWHERLLSWRSRIDRSRSTTRGRGSTGAPQGQTTTAAGTPARLYERPVIVWRRAPRGAPALPLPCPCGAPRVPLLMRCQNAKIRRRRPHPRVGGGWRSARPARSSTRQRLHEGGFGRLPARRPSHGAPTGRSDTLADGNARRPQRAGSRASNTLGRKAAMLNFGGRL